MPTPNPHLRNSDGYYPLHLAARDGNVSRVRECLAQGANAFAQVDGLTAEEIARLAFARCNDETRTQDYLDVIAALPKPSLIKQQYNYLFRRHLSAQGWILKRIQAMGLDIGKGICCGGAYMGMQALLHEERDTEQKLLEMQIFNKRINRMRDIALDVFAKKMRETQNRVKHKKRLSEKQKIDITIPSFLQGIALYQRSWRYAWFYRAAGLPIPFQQDTTHTIPLLETERLKQAGGIVCAQQVSGVYSATELLEYFTTVRSHLQNTNYVTPLILSTKTHTVLIGYDPIRREWIWGDVAQWPLQAVPSTQTLIDLLLPTLSSTYATHGALKQGVAFTTRFFCTQINQSNLIHHLANLHTLHPVTQHKANLITDDGDSLFACACRAGDIDLAQALLRKRSFLKSYGKQIALTSIGINAILLAALLGAGALSLMLAPIIISTIALTVTLLAYGYYWHEKKQLQLAQDTITSRQAGSTPKPLTARFFDKKTIITPVSSTNPELFWPDNNPQPT